MIKEDIQRRSSRRVFVLLVLILLPLGACVDPKDNKIRIAVASNFVETAREIQKRFEAKTGHTINISAGSTGKHYAQITNGAPFDIFLAADSKHPGLLEQNGFTVSGSRFTYAVGRLVLWSAKPGFVDRDAAVLKSRDIRHIAIANPKLAPYGVAAVEVLRTRGLDATDLSGQIVKGENVGQTFQFVKTGNADLGFVAYSQVKRPGENIEGSMSIIPEDQYSPIDQQAVLLNDVPVAREFIEFLKSPEIIELIRSYGYGTP